MPGQGGLSLDFSAERVVLDCGEAHVARRYTVENAASQVLVSVNNGAAPFTLALQPNGTFAGSGNVEVSGRVVTGSTGNGITFAATKLRAVPLASWLQQQELPQPLLSHHRRGLSPRAVAPPCCP